MNGACGLVELSVMCLDGRINFDIEFLDKTMSTPIYVKMDAHEQLLLSEGVCRQLGIITYHPEVQSLPPTKLVECSPSVSKDSGGLCRIPSVKVQLVKSVKLPPNHSVMVETRLVGETRSPHGPMLLEADNRLRDERVVVYTCCVVLYAAATVACLCLHYTYTLSYVYMTDCYIVSSSTPLSYLLLAKLMLCLLRKSHQVRVT